MSPSPSRSITKRSVDAIKGGGADTVYWDGELTGFGLRVRRSGRKSHVVQTRVAGGKLRWFTIGPHGPLNPDLARTRALEILASAKKGVDPRGAAARRDAEPSMADLGRRFLEEYVPVHCKPSTQQEWRCSSTRQSGSCGFRKYSARTLPRCTTACGTNPIRRTGRLGFYRRCSAWPRSGAGVQTAPTPAAM